MARRVAAGRSRGLSVGALLLAGCQAHFEHRLDLEYANARMTHQTQPEAIALVDHDVAPRYLVLGDLRVRGSGLAPWSPMPTRPQLALREQAAALGADAVICVSFDEGRALFFLPRREAVGRAIRYW